MLGLADRIADISSSFYHVLVIHILKNSDVFSGVRQYHFPIYYDPAGTNYTSNAGLKIANQSANVSATDAKWTYPGNPNVPSVLSAQ